MQIVLTALHRACQSSVLQYKHSTLVKFQARAAMKGHSASGMRGTLVNTFASIGLGACLFVSVPALAAPSQNHAAPAPATALKSKAPLGEADPLEAIASVGAAETPAYAKVVEAFVTSMPLTNPPVAEGDTEDDIDVTPVEYMEFEEMRVPLWIVDTILRASEATGADPVYMMALADKESSFLPGNKASTSSAVGLFQFISSTWLEAVRSFGPRHGMIAEAQSIESQDGKLIVQNDAMREHILGLRRNPYLSALMAAEMMKRDKAKIESKLGRKLSRSEFYLSHFFGVDSASKFIALVDDTPKKSAPDAFPAAAKSNKSLFFAKDGKKTRQLSVAEVYGKIDGMIDKRLNRYEDVSMRATADASF